MKTTNILPIVDYSIAQFCYACYMLCHLICNWM